ncbi:unnamed protein product [Sympodiomycopsis kandeliae]
MGVQGLWSLLQPAARPIKLEDLEGKRFAVDSSIWLYHFRMAMRDKEGRTLSNAHILGFFWRICKLLHFGLRPVFVFDGGAPVMKRQTLIGRKTRKQGAKESHALAAKKLLHAQMRQAAIEHVSAGRGAPGPSSTGDGDDHGMGEDVVYFDDYQQAPAPAAAQQQTSRETASPSKAESSKKKNTDYHRDPYALPNLDEDISSVTADSSRANRSEAERDGKRGRGRRTDFRFATDGELRHLLSSITPSDIDMSSPLFRSLPFELQYELVGDMRAASRGTSYKRLQQMLKTSPNPIDFSKAQVLNLKTRNELTQRVLEVTDEIGDANIRVPIRVAGERNREYVLVRREGDEGGFVLGVRNQQGTSKEKAIVVGGQSERIDISSSDDEDDYDSDDQARKRRKPNNHHHDDEDDLEMDEVDVPSLPITDSDPPSKPSSSEAPYKASDANNPVVRKAIAEQLLSKRADEHIRQKMREKGIVDEGEILEEQLRIARLKTQQDTGKGLFSPAKTKNRPQSSARSERNGSASMEYYERLEGYHSADDDHVTIDSESDLNEDEDTALQAALIQDLHNDNDDQTQESELDQDELEDLAKALQASDGDGSHYHLQDEIENGDEHERGQQQERPEDKEDDLEMELEDVDADKAENFEADAYADFYGDTPAEVQEEYLPLETDKVVLPGPREKVEQQENKSLPEDLRPLSDVKPQSQSVERTRSPATSKSVEAKGSSLGLESPRKSPPSQKVVPSTEEVSPEPLKPVTTNNSSQREHHAERKSSSSPLIESTSKSTGPKQSSPSIEEANKLDIPDPELKAIDGLAKQPAQITDKQAQDPVQPDVSTMPAADKLAQVVAGVDETEIVSGMRNEGQKVKEEPLEAEAGDLDQVPLVQEDFDGTSQEVTLDNQFAQVSEQQSAHIPTDAEAVQKATESPKSVAADADAEASIARDAREDARLDDPVPEASEVHRSAHPSSLVNADAEEDGQGSEPEIARRGRTDPQVYDSDEGTPIEWSPSPSPAPPTLGPDGFPLPTVEELEKMDDEYEQEAAELQGDASDIAAFLSRTKGQGLIEAQAEIAKEVEALRAEHVNTRKSEEEITKQMAREIQMMLRLFGLPYITAPMEAEAQCAELVSQRLVDGIITDDSDVFLFGGTRIYKNMFNNNKVVECFLLSDIQRELGLDREKLVRLAYLLGSDYTEGLPSVGPVVAMEVLSLFPGSDGLLRFREWWLKVQGGKDTPEDTRGKTMRRIKKTLANKVHIDDQWPNPAVLEAYYEPSVDSSDEPFQWGLPDLDNLRLYLAEYLGWPTTKTDQYVVPVIEAQSRRSRARGNQSTLDRNGFFDVSGGTGVYVGRTMPKYGSARLQNVVNGFRQANSASTKRSSATGRGGARASRRTRAPSADQADGDVEVVEQSASEPAAAGSKTADQDFMDVPEEQIGKAMSKNRPIVRREQLRTTQREAQQELDANIAALEGSKDKEASPKKASRPKPRPVRAGQNVEQESSHVTPRNEPAADENSDRDRDSDSDVGSDDGSEEWQPGTSSNRNRKGRDTSARARGQGRRGRGRGGRGGRGGKSGGVADRSVNEEGQETTETQPIAQPREDADIPTDKDPGAEPAKAPRQRKPARPRGTRGGPRHPHLVAGRNMRLDGPIPESRSEPLRPETIQRHRSVSRSSSSSSLNTTPVGAHGRVGESPSQLLRPRSVSRSASNQSLQGRQALERRGSDKSRKAKTGQSDSAIEIESSEGDEA